MASLGQALKEEREARNISIEEIASATKIVPRYIEALENDRFDLMPGGFFVKAIIRTYARAVGLNEDEVLAKYRAAGALGEPERKRPLFSKSEPAAAASRPVSPPPPATASSHEAAAPPSPPPPPPPSPSPDTTQILVPPKPEPEPELSILPAPKAPMDPAKKKRIISWVVGGLLFVLAVALVIILWPSGGSRPGPAQKDAPPPSSQTRTAAPPPKQTAAAPGAEPATALKPEPEPVVEEVWTGVTIEISFEAETWIQVYADGVLKLDGLFPPGAKARAQAAERLLIHVGNAGGFSFLLNGKPAKPLGRAGQVITDIKITPDNIKDFLQVVGSPGPPAG
jgi:cytoskeleton protein RodZ